MTSGHIDLIDRSVEKTHVWLNELADELGESDRHAAYRALRVLPAPIRALFAESVR